MDWLIDKWMGRWIGWSICWLVGWLIDDGWVNGLPGCRHVDCFIFNWLENWKAGWFIGLVPREFVIYMAVSWFLKNLTCKFMFYVIYNSILWRVKWCKVVSTAWRNRGGGGGGGWDGWRGANPVIIKLTFLTNEEFPLNFFLVRFCIS